MTDFEASDAIFENASGDKAEKREVPSLTLNLNNV